MVSCCCIYTALVSLFSISYGQQQQQVTVEKKNNYLRSKEGRRLAAVCSAECEHTLGLRLSYRLKEEEEEEGEREAAQMDLFP